MAFPNVGTLFATVIKNYRRTLADNLSTHSVVLALLRKYGFIREDSGGTSIVESLLYGSNTTVKSFYKYEPFDLTPQEGIDQAEFPWKQIGGTVSISGLEEFQNQGPSRIINLLEAKLTQLDISFREAVNAQILSDGTGNSGKDITGLQAAVEDGSAWSIYGSIDSNVYTWWRNYYLNFSGTYTSFDTADGTSVEGMTVLRNAHSQVMRKMEKPGLSLTSRELYNEYEKHAEGDKMRIVTYDAKLADMGFENLKFRGTVIAYDDDCPAGYWWFLNPQYLKFVIGKGRNFKVGEFEESREQEAKSAKIILYCQLTCSNRARQGLITNFT
jgi:hypothetical protein